MATAVGDVTVIITCQSDGKMSLAIFGDVVQEVSKNETDITQQWMKKLETNGLCTFQNASNSHYMRPDERNTNPNGVKCGGDKFQWIIQSNTIRSSTEPSKAIKMVAKEKPVKFVTYDAANSSFFMWDITEV